MSAPSTSASAGASLTDRPAGTAADTRRRGWAARLFEPVAAAPLVQFRVVLGLLLLWDAYRFLAEDWHIGLFIVPKLLFSFYGFEWVRPLSADGMTAVMIALAVLGLCVAAGFVYRIAAVLLCLGWAYIFLLDQAEYLNHMYLIVLVTGLMALLPAHRALSVDALLRPKLRADSVPRWTLALLRAQIGLVYFFGGVAKLNPDWFSGIPMQLMLLSRADLLGQLAGEPSVALVFAYSGLMFDLLIVPLIWWRRTRILGLLMVTGFHLTNHVLFDIGVFPWFMLAATLILWPPLSPTLLHFGRLYLPLVVVGLLLSRYIDRPVPLWSWGLIAVFAYLLAFPPNWLRQTDHAAEPAPSAAPPRVQPLVLAAFTLYLGWQCLMPLRHWVYPGDVSWTEQGHKWSWHMKLRVKHPVEATFFIIDGDGRLQGTVRPLRPLPPPNQPDWAPPISVRQARTMATRPELAVQFAQFLARDAAEQGIKPPVKVTANILVSLNGRRPQLLLDPEADLASVTPAMWPPAAWIMPLTEPRPKLRRFEIAPQPPGAANDNTDAEIE